jgi:pyridoxamine 5'-phosphate oxidase
MPDQTATRLHADPFARFADWFAEAAASEPNDPNAMTVASSTADGRPSARIVLLKDYDARGFVFYTNKHSRKGGELNANPQVALLFHWKSLQRQVRIEGVVEDVTDAEADAYYDSRARVSRLGAWASLQSQPLPDRADLERRVAETDARHPGEAIPRPPHWSGYRVVPRLIEFWQDMPFRLHDRTVFTRSGDGWATSKLYP